jgi:hypothetical protein
VVNILYWRVKFKIKITPKKKELGINKKITHHNLGLKGETKNQ